MSILPTHQISTGSRLQHQIINTERRNTSIILSNNQSSLGLHKNIVYKWRAEHLKEVSLIRHKSQKVNSYFNKLSQPQFNLQNSTIDDALYSKPQRNIRPIIPRQTSTTNLIQIVNEVNSTVKYSKEKSNELYNIHSHLSHLFKEMEKIEIVKERKISPLTERINTTRLNIKKDFRIRKPVCISSLKMRANKRIVLQPINENLTHSIDYFIEKKPSKEPTIRLATSRNANYIQKYINQLLPKNDGVLYSVNKSFKLS